MEVSVHITIDVDFGQNTEKNVFNFLLSQHTQRFEQRQEKIFYLIIIDWKLKIVDYLNKPLVVCG